MTRHRGLVKGSTRKIVPQKGSGGARHGSIKAPIFVGGGIAHGPVVRSHAQRLNNKTASLATRVALSTKFAQGNLEVVERAATNSHKTRDLVALLKRHGWKKSVLIIGSDSVTINLRRAAQNIPNVTVLPRYEVNVYDILRHEKLIMSVNSINFLERMFRNDPMKY